MAGRGRRSYGTGHLKDKNGVWDAQIRDANGRCVHKVLGKVRKPGSADGLTKAQAEKKLAELKTAVGVLPAERLTFAEAAAQRMHHLEHVAGRKPTTLEDYRG